MLDKVDDVSQITTSEIQEALGGVEINECANVGAVSYTHLDVYKRQA